MPLALNPKKKTSEINNEEVEKIATAMGCETLIAQILYNRGLTDVEDCKRFINPDESEMLNPFTMLNMDRLIDEINGIGDEKITVYGDYDVDGISAVTILVTALRRLNRNVDYIIPDRHNDGYGLNDTLLEKAFAGGTKLLITVDCGIASVDLIKKYNCEGRKIIVTDHHTIGEALPDCIVVKPGQPNDTYKNPNLCGAGIAFKIATALSGENEDLVDFAAIATVADVVSLTGENRYIVKKGLERINGNTRPCIKAILESAGIADNTVNATNIAFAVSPRINAAGRIASYEIALDLLLNNKLENAQILNELNAKRKQLEGTILEEIKKQIKQKGIIRDKKIIVIGGDGWDSGVIGICAARLMEEYHRPAIVFSINDGIAKGSGRSVDGINLYELLQSASDILIQFGGHPKAAGMSVEASRLDELADRLDQSVNSFYDQKLLYPIAKYDARAHVSDITYNFVKQLDLLEPYGCGNEEVFLRFDNGTPIGVKTMGAGNNHLHFNFQDDTGILRATVFNFEKSECDYFNLTSCTLIAKPVINSFRNNESIELIVDNAKEIESINPNKKAEELTAMFYSRLRYQKNGTSNAMVISDNEDMECMISDWADDISGTLILCDHPEYAKGLISMLSNEAPRFDISYYKPINNACGYNALVVGAELDKIDFTPYKRVILYDMINPGYADYIKALAPNAEIFAKKCGMDLFDSIYEEYRALSRDNMMLAYKAFILNAGKFESEREYFERISNSRQIPMPIIAVALYTFVELGFIDITDKTVTIVKDAPKRRLEECRLYTGILKCINRRG